MTSASVKTNHRSLVSLKLPTSVAALVEYAQQIVKAMSGNAAFPSPVPALTVLLTAIGDLQAAQAVARTRVQGAVINRNEKKTALVALLEQLKGYVQATADANIENGASIIASAGMGVRKPVVRGPRAFSARPGPLSGTAKLLAAPAGHRAGYEWQYSTDGGKSWVPASFTLQAKATITGLTPGAAVQFRYRPVTKTGEGDWSQTVVLIVK